jgi:hypothetical protein
VVHILRCPASTFVPSLSYCAVLWVLLAAPPILVATRRNTSTGLRLRLVYHSIDTSPFRQPQLQSINNTTISRIPSNTHHTHRPICHCSFPFAFYVDLIPIAFLFVYLSVYLARAVLSLSLYSPPKHSPCFAESTTTALASTPPSCPITLQPWLPATSYLRRPDISGCCVAP